MTTYKKISRLKKKQIKVNKSFADQMNRFAQFISEQENTDLTPSDVIASILLTNQKARDIKLDAVEKTEVDVILPEDLWDDVIQKTKDSGVPTGEYFTKAIEPCFRDKNFQKWDQRNGSKRLD